MHKGVGDTFLLPGLNFGILSLILVIGHRLPLLTFLFLLLSRLNQYYLLKRRNFRRNYSTYEEGVHIVPKNFYDFGVIFLTVIGDEQPVRNPNDSLWVSTRE